MITNTFKVRETKHLDPVTFKVRMPQSHSDTGLITKRFGTFERMIDRANAQWTVDVAVGIRKRLPNVDDATAYASAYCDNGSKDTFVPSIDIQKARALGFTPEQLKFVEESGMQVPGMEFMSNDELVEFMDERQEA